MHNIRTMLVQRRRWADGVQMLYKCFVFWVVLLPSMALYAVGRISWKHDTLSQCYFNVGYLQRQWTTIETTLD